MKKVAIFLYDITGIMAAPWIEAGYECWLFDGQHPSGISFSEGLYKVGIWFKHDLAEEQAAEIAWMVGGKADFIGSFPDCTDMTNAGSKHWAKKREKNPLFLDEAVALARFAEKVADACQCDRWFVENPVGKLSTLWRKPDFWFDPCDFGGYLPPNDNHPQYPSIYPARDAYNKKTGIWCGPGFSIPIKHRIEPMHKANPGWAKLGGKSQRTKNIRSTTPRGFSNAVCIANKDN